MSEDGDGGSSAIDDGGDSASYASDDSGVESSVEGSDDAGSSGGGWEDDGSGYGTDATDSADDTDSGSETDPASGTDAGYGTAPASGTETTVDAGLAGIEADAELGALPAGDAPITGEGTLLAGATVIPGEGLVPVDDAAVGGAAVTGVATSAGVVAVDPSTVVGRPDLSQDYFRFQGTGNAFCGPVSAAMTLNTLMGGNGPSAEEVLQFAIDQGWMRQDRPDKPEWGYWSGMSAPQLEQLMDAYLAPSGGDAQQTTGTLDDLEAHLSADHPVTVMVDSGELQEGGAYDASDERSENHFLQVTGIDRVHGQVFLNDPAKTAPSVMPLAQFEAAWKDSNNLMLDVRTAVSAPMPSPADPLADPDVLADPSLAAIPGAPSPSPATGCCVLPMTLELTPSGPSGVAPPAPVDPLAAPGQSVAPDQPGLAAPASGVGAPLVPLPAATGAPMQIGDPGWATPTGWDAAGNVTHVRSNIPIDPPTEMVQFGGNDLTPAGPATSGPSPAAAEQLARLQEMYRDGQQNALHPWLYDGITRTGSSSAGFTYGAAGGDHDTLGDAYDALRDRP